MCKACERADALKYTFNRFKKSHTCKLGGVKSDFHKVLLNVKAEEQERNRKKGMTCFLVTSTHLFSSHAVSKRGACTECLLSSATPAPATVSLARSNAREAR